MGNSTMGNLGLAHDARLLGRRISPLSFQGAGRILRKRLRRRGRMQGWEFTSQCKGWEGKRQSPSRRRQGKAGRAKSKVRGWSLRTWSLRGSLGMVTSPAWPLPAEGAQGLRIHRLSGEVTTRRGMATGEVPLGPEPQAEPRQQPQNPPTWERDTEGWLNADGRK